MIYDGDSTHVVSWGDTQHNCDRAAQLSEHLKKAMGWPEKLWSTMPSRIIKLHRLVGDVVREAEQAGIGGAFLEKWGKFKKDLTEHVKKIKEPAGEG